MSATPRPIDITPEQPRVVEAGVVEAGVVEFGDERAPRRRPAMPSLRPLLADRRVVPLAAALAAVAALGSLMSEWQVTTIGREVFGGELGDRMVSTRVADLGAAGAGYLLGMFAVAAALVLATAGPLAGRAYARLIGLSAAGVALGLLGALAGTLGTESRAFPDIYRFQLDGQEIVVAYGRGLWCALAAVLLAGAALYLSGRPAAAVAAPPAPDEAVTEQPLELTVAAVPAFDDHDKPATSGRRGISG